MSDIISIIVPVYNEQDNIATLCQSVTAAMEKSEIDYELIIVDDGSTDASNDVLLSCVKENPRIRIISFNHNYGQTAAMMAGFDHAAHDIIVAMDGDLQNDPNDIPALVEKINEGYDVVSGWRKERQDHKIKRNLLSKIANKIISKISGIPLHDYGCTLKAYRKEILTDVKLYGEMHRFIPVYAHWSGAKVCEIPVKHHKRIFGNSKYGLDRIFKVCLDLMLIKFLLSYNTRPIHVFGGCGFLCFGISLLSGLWAIYLRLFEGISFIQTPLPLLVVMTFITGMMCILLGLLAEVMVRIYYETQNKSAYRVKSDTKACK